MDQRPKDLGVKTLKLLNENIGKISQDIWFGNDFLDMI